MFGPQKGADADDVAALERGLGRLAHLIDAHPLARAAVLTPGAGAAGGVGYAALAVLGARREPGIEVVQRLTGLAERIAAADLVVTGEGSLDAQSLGGKTPLGVAAAARAASVPVVAVCGRTTLEPAALAAAGFAAVYALADLEPDPAVSMAEALPLLAMGAGQTLAISLLAILFAAALGGSTWTAMMAISLATIPAFVRIARAATLQVMSQGYIEAARLSGTPTATIAACASPTCLPAFIRKPPVWRSMRPGARRWNASSKAWSWRRAVRCGPD